MQWDVPGGDFFRSIVRVNCGISDSVRHAGANPATSITEREDLTTSRIFGGLRAAVLAVLGLKARIGL